MDEENLNENVEEVVDDAEIITVPIDTTLTHSGEAADAKAVGDALALKANISDITSNITVDGQSKDANGNILVKAEHIPYAEGVTTKEKIDEIDAKTADDIPMVAGESSQSVADAIEFATNKTADVIPVTEGSSETVGDRFNAIEVHFLTDEESISENAQSITDLGNTIDGMQDEIDDELTDEEINTLVDACFVEGGE